MQTVLVTGANGFVGSYLVKALLQQNCIVIASGRSEGMVEIGHPNFRYQVLDFTDRENVINVFSNLEPTVVIHCGAMSKPDDCELNKEAAFLSNVSGTVYLLQEAEKHKAHFIFLSTDFVFFGETGMYKEDELRSPVNYYGQTKVWAEDEVMRYPFAWTIVRTVLVYGKSLNGKENFIQQIVNGVRAGKEFKIFNDQIRTPTYVEDLAKGLVAIIERNATGVYHISGKDRVTVYEAACRAAQLNGFDTKNITPIQEGELIAPAKRPKKTGFNIDKARKELGYEPVSFLEGLRKTFSVNA